MFRWYQELSISDRRAFWGAYGGRGLDALDVQIFSFLIPSLIGTLGITRGEVGLLVGDTPHHGEVVECYVVDRTDERPSLPNCSRRDEVAGRP
jgi:hypothetical protein